MILGILLGLIYFKLLTYIFLISPICIFTIMRTCIITMTDKIDFYIRQKLKILMKHKFFSLLDIYFSKTSRRKSHDVLPYSFCIRRFTIDTNSNRLSAKFRVNFIKFFYFKSSYVVDSSYKRTNYSVYIRRFTHI